MRAEVMIGLGLAIAAAPLPAESANKGPGKAAPVCSAITFRPLPSGMPDGEQQAGIYKSRYARLELRADVKQGNPADYYVTTAGKRIGAAPATLPEAIAACAAAKKMPPPQSAASPCIGQRFRVVVAHAGDQRLALLYAEDGANWRFCSAGTF